MKTADFIASAKSVIDIEAQTIQALESSLNDDFVKACQTILNCDGRVIVTGMGKSGHIANKIAATLASTGTPAFFVHPGEASHGDLGMITPKDLLLAISNSGETPEVLTILPIVKRMGVPLIGIASSANSSLANLSDIYLNITIGQEACPMNLAPTASTTATLVLGDALAIAILNARDFNENDFARSHPGGSLGRRLLLYVDDIMHKNDEMPLVSENAPLSEALMEMNSKGLGVTGLINESDELTGIYTDGDLRRTLTAEVDIKAPMAEFMTKDPITVGNSMLAAELVALMKQRNINAVFVVDEQNRPIGALNMHDLLKSGVL
jgi:arabinose-5-phosphate isomerase